MRDGILVVRDIVLDRLAKQRLEGLREHGIPRAWLAEGVTVQDVVPLLRTDQWWKMSDG